MRLHEPDLPFEKATFGMGCFWAPESMFGCSKGVLRTRVGFAGGAKRDPTYRHPLKYPVPPAHDETEALGTEMASKHQSMLRSYDESRQFASASKNIEKRSGTNMAEMSSLLSQSAFIGIYRYIPKTSNPRCKYTILTFRFRYHQKYRLQRHTALYKSLQESGMKDITKSHVAARLNGYVGGFGTLEAFEAEWQQLGLSSEQANAIRALIRKGGFK
ncbi:unnamed protein product [Ixodes hexagonus]